MVGFMKGLGCGCCQDCVCENEPRTVCEYTDPFDWPSIKADWLDNGFQPTTIDTSNNKALQGGNPSGGTFHRIILGKSGSAVQAGFDYIFPTNKNGTSTITCQLTPPRLVVPQNVAYWAEMEIAETWGTHQARGRGQRFMVRAKYGRQYGIAIPGQWADLIVVESDALYLPSNPLYNPARRKWQYLTSGAETSVTFTLNYVSSDTVSIDTPLGSLQFEPYETVALGNPCDGFTVTLSCNIGTLSPTGPRAYWNNFSFVTT